VADADEREEFHPPLESFTLSWVDAPSRRVRRCRARRDPLRSYSSTILIALNMSETTNIATISSPIAANPIPTTCDKPKVGYARISFLCPSPSSLGTGGS
jgi:hypothetical protein